MALDNQKILTETKLRLNKSSDDSYDGILSSYIGEAQAKVKNYCNRRNLPDALFYTIVSIVIDLYKYRSDGSRHVLSETQGNRHMTYAGKSDIDAIVSEYSAELNRYRRIRTS